MKIRLIIEYEEMPDGSHTCTLTQNVDPPMKISTVAVLGILEAVKLDVGVSNDCEA